MTAAANTVGLVVSLFCVQARRALAGCQRTSGTFGGKPIALSPIDRARSGVRIARFAGI